MNVQKLSSIKNSLVESNVQPTSKKMSEKNYLKLDKIITTLQKKGYNFVSLEEW